MNTLTYKWNQLRKELRRLGSSNSFRDNAGNSIYGIAEYITLPVIMVLTAPYLIHRLGPEQFGVWMLVSAIVGSMGTLSTGFGGATIKYVASYRGRNDQAGVEHIVRSTLSINLLLGAILALIVWIGAPASVDHVFKVEQDLRPATVVAIRVGAILLVIRSAEGVFVSTLRAFECYGPAVILNVVGRALTLLTAVVLASFGIGIVGLMAATLVIATLELILQMAAARRTAGGISMTPIFTGLTGEVFSYGCFSWIQAFAGVVFAYADRLVVASLLGTAAVAYYAVCVQATQPIHGLVGAGFNFLFPHLSVRADTEVSVHTRLLIRRAILTNLSVALMLCVPLALFGKTILRIWMGSTFANETQAVFPVLALAFGILAMNVVPYYALFALGHVRLVTILNLVGGVATIVVSVLLIPLIGLRGAAIGRLLYGPITCISYFKLSYLLVAKGPEVAHARDRKSAQQWARNSSGVAMVEAADE